MCIGYIYIRWNKSYEKHGAVKLGKTESIPNRNSNYITSEIERGHFIVVFSVPLKKMGIIENLLKTYFQQHNIYLDGGTEFFSNIIVDQIEPYLQTLNIEYQCLSKEEIDSLIRKQYIKNIVKKIQKKGFADRIRKVFLENASAYTPRDYQIDIINKSVGYFKINDKGLLVLPCGSGKTVISLWIAKMLVVNNLLIGVPNLELLSQWKHVVKKIFPNFSCLQIGNGQKVKKIFGTKFVLITTYHSAYKIRENLSGTDVLFDCVIFDEAHHLTTKYMDPNDTKKHIETLKIPVKRQIALTATIKDYENGVSNSDDNYFGKIIDKKCLLWAIEKQYICDYVIQTVKTDCATLDKHSSECGIHEENDKRLFLGAYVALKSIADGYSHHLIVYLNSIENSKKLIEFANLLLEKQYFDINGLYYNHYDSEQIDKKSILNNFEDSINGILTCVYSLGEGWDLPLLDGVVFVENMSSEIRIVQSALRPCRKNCDELDKINKIILPIMNNEDFLVGNGDDYKKIREVVYQMALEDETIQQKIFCSTIEFAKGNVEKSESTNEFGEYDDEFTKQLQLRTLKRQELDITYAKAKEIIKKHGCKTKCDYLALCKINIRLPEDPRERFQKTFEGWIPYLSIEPIYYSLDECKQKIKEYLREYSCLKDYIDLQSVCNKLCALDSKFPPNDLWVDYYNHYGEKLNNLSDIIRFEAMCKKKIPALV